MFVLFYTNPETKMKKMSINILFVLLSFVIGIFATKYIRSFDIHEKEPLSKMLLVVLWGGVWSMFISVLIYWQLHSRGG